MPHWLLEEGDRHGEGVPSRGKGGKGCGPMVQRRVSYRLACSRLAISADAVTLFNTNTGPY